MDKIPAGDESWSDEPISNKLSPEALESLNELDATHKMIYEEATMGNIPSEEMVELKPPSRFNLDKTEKILAGIGGVCLYFTALIETATDWNSKPGLFIGLIGVSSINGILMRRECRKPPPERYFHRYDDEE